MNCSYKFSGSAAFLFILISLGMISFYPSVDQSAKGENMTESIQNSGKTASQVKKSKVPQSPGKLPRSKRTIKVGSSAELTNALMNANAGDHIVLADGTYEGNFTLSKDGTAKAPIIVRAENPHNAILTGIFNIDGAHAWLFQLKFQPGRMQISAPDAKVLRCKFHNNNIPPNIIGIRHNAQRAEIACNEFRDYGDPDVKWFLTIRVYAGGDIYPQDVHIHHNYLLNQRSHSGIIGIGVSKSNTDSEIRAIVEWNLIENARYTAVHVKSAKNMIRFNTVRQIDYTEPSGYLSRHSYSNTFIANVSLNASGVRVYGKNHRVIGNYNDDARKNANNYHAALRGTIFQDDFKSSEENHQPVAEGCLFSGNIGGLAIGSGYSHQKLKAINNIIEAHIGEIIYVEDYHSGTIDKRDSPPSVPIPKYVILNPGDVGPDAP